MISDLSHFHIVKHSSAYILNTSTPLGTDWFHLVLMCVYDSQVILEFMTALKVAALDNSLIMTCVNFDFIF